jgi:hypothetical protein
MQRSFEPMQKQVEVWQRRELTDVTAKVVIYEAFVEGKLEAPKHLARSVHDLYFEPKYEEFQSRTIWSLSNAFTSAFKELEPIPQFKATAKGGMRAIGINRAVIECVRHMVPFLWKNGSQVRYSGLP